MNVLISKLDASPDQESRNNILISYLLSLERGVTSELEVRQLWEYIAMNGFPGKDVYSAVLSTLDRVMEK